MVLRIFFICYICALPIKGNAQIFGKQNSISKKVQIGLSTSGYSFFDGSPMFQNSTTYNVSYFAKTRGYEISYLFNELNGVQLSYNNVDIYYTLSNIKPIGSILERDFSLFSVTYLRKVFSRKYLYIFLSSGLSYRYGGEYYIVGYGWFDVQSEGKLLNDFGLSIGSNITIPIVKGLNTNIGLKYTGFVYRNDTGGSIYYDDNGSSQQMFTISLGIGYAFSFKKKQKEFTE